MIVGLFAVIDIFFIIILSTIIIILTSNARPGDGAFHIPIGFILTPFIILNIIFLIQDVRYFFTGNLGIIQFARGLLSIPISIVVLIIFIIIKTQ